MMLEFQSQIEFLEFEVSQRCLTQQENLSANQEKYNQMSQLISEIEKEIEIKSKKRDTEKISSNLKRLESTFEECFPQVSANNYDNFQNHILFVSKLIGMFIFMKKKKIFSEEEYNKKMENYFSRNNKLLDQVILRFDLSSKLVLLCAENAYTNLRISAANKFMEILKKRIFEEFNVNHKLLCLYLSTKEKLVSIEEIEKEFTEKSGNINKKLLKINSASLKEEDEDGVLKTTPSALKLESKEKADLLRSLKEISVMEKGKHKKFLFLQKNFSVCSKSSFGDWRKTCF